VAVVEADPHGDDQGRRVADEPRVAVVVRRARSTTPASIECTT
jgi:hypothetical protein